MKLNTGWSGLSCAPPAVAVRPLAKRAPAPIVLGSEAQLDRDADDRARIAVRDALSTREYRLASDVARRVPASYRWRVPEVLRELAKAGALESNGLCGSYERWRRRI